MVIPTHAGVILGSAYATCRGSIKSFLFDFENLQDVFDLDAGTGIMETDRKGNPETVSFALKAKYRAGQEQWFADKHV